MAFDRIAWWYYRVVTGGGAQPWARVGLNRATVLELFFDLAFVLVLAQLSHHLLTHLSWRGLFETVVLTAALWWIWTVVTWVTDLYDSEHPGLQILVTVLTFGVIAMAVGIQGAFAGHGMTFASAYVGVHLLRNSAVLVAARGISVNLPSLRIMLWPLVTAPLWFIGAALQGWWQLALWAVGVVTDYESIGAGRPVPLLGGLPGLWQVGGEHLAERYRQLLLMGLGDAFLTMGAAWIDSPSTPLRGAALVLTFLYTTLLFQSYFRAAGQRLAEMIDRSSRKVRAARLAVDCHLLMLVGIVVTSVGIDLIIRHPLEHTHGFWTGLVIIVGPALFMLGRILFGWLVLDRLSPSRVTTLIGLLAITPFAGVLPPVLNGVAVTAVLAFVQLPRISKRFARWIHEPVLEEE